MTKTCFAVGEHPSVMASVCRKSPYNMPILSVFLLLLLCFLPLGGQKKKEVNIQQSSVYISCLVGDLNVCAVWSVAGGPDVSVRETRKSLLETTA